SMPMKCIDQMPMPIEAAPPSSQSRPARRSAPATRSVSRRAVYETRMATTTESVTSQGLYVACIPGKLPEMRQAVQCAYLSYRPGNCDAVDTRPNGAGISAAVASATLDCQLLETAHVRAERLRHRHRA